MDNGASSYRRFLDGDKSAFDDILCEYRQPLTLFINRYVHDMWASEDIAIDVFTFLIVNPRHYNFKVQLKTYLFMLGRSRALDHLRRKKRIAFTELTEAEAIEAGDGPEEELLRNERKMAVMKAVKDLPRDMKEAVLLFYFEELSYEEIARVMKKNRKQIDNLLYRARLKLKEVLGEEGSL